MLSVSPPLCRSLSRTISLWIISSGRRRPAPTVCAGCWTACGCASAAPTPCRTVRRRFSLSWRADRADGRRP